VPRVSNSGLRMSGLVGKCVAGTLGNDGTCEFSVSPYRAMPCTSATYRWGRSLTPDRRARS
jgi:hypothetical protein